ncbi:MAG: AzlC family ABC transporter permease [Cohaesibacteraceae bacterium]|nr:AzlC family ABC transporter permease [Cohaesibacteraceae bacterium]
MIREFRQGALAILPIAIAALPIGVLFGSLSVKAGFSVIETSAFSLLIFAGAAQFVVLDLWNKDTVIELLVLAVFLVNLRHIMMGASISRQIGHFPAFLRYFGLYFLTDETWAMAEKEALNRKLSTSWYFGLCLGLFVCWNCWTLLGALFGQLMPPAETMGFDFAFTAMFLVLILGFWKGPRTGAILVSSALASSLAFLYLPAPWYILIGGFAGMATSQLMLPRLEKDSVQCGQ